MMMMTRMIMCSILAVIELISQLSLEEVVVLLYSCSGDVLFAFN